MDFDFIDQSADLHGVRRTAILLRRAANNREPERKSIMKGAKASGDTELHQLMSKVRPPAWYAIVDCEFCPQQSLITAHGGAATRFDCPSCKQPASLAWVEEHAREKVTKMYDAYVVKKLKTKKREMNLWEKKSRVLHAKAIKKGGCKVKKNTVSRLCPWCEL